MPLYGRSFANTDGIGKPYNGTGAGSWEKGVWDFKALPQPGAQEYYDKEAGATYSYDQSTKTLVSYDTLGMARKKAQWIKQKGLGGAMWWELSGDRQDEGSIVSGVSLQPLVPKNKLFTSPVDCVFFGGKILRTSASLSLFCFRTTHTKRATSRH